MKLSNKIYDVLKYVAIIGLPALAIFWKTLAPVWGTAVHQQRKL